MSTDTRNGRGRRRWLQMSLRSLFLLVTLFAIALATYVAWPPLALDGYCPVTLVKKEVWQRGDVFCFAVHDGCLYRFTSKAEREQFREAPETYAPVASGNDITVAVDQGTAIRGSRQHGCFYKGRVYLFRSEAAYSKFEAAPERYVEKLQSPKPDASVSYALDGYCPVTLQEEWQWKLGRAQYSADRNGKTYLFTGPEEKRRFLAEPEKYEPAFSGNDIVLAMDEGQVVSGKRVYGLIYDEMIYLFEGEESLSKFNEDPVRYARPFEKQVRNSNEPKSAART